MDKRNAEAPRESDLQPFEIRAAWRLSDPDFERDAVAFWRRTSLLPPDVEPEERAKELVAIGYHADRVVGVATAHVGYIKTLRAKFAGFRCAVDPEFRRRKVAAALTMFSRDLLEQWSLDHPDEKVLGLAAVVESTDLSVRLREPVWGKSHLNLAHFLPNGRQLRVAWFTHARLDP